MADSFNKKEREKKRKKRRQEKAELKKQRKLEGKKTDEFMYLDEDGNLTSTPPDPNKKKREIKLEEIKVSTPKQSELDAEESEIEGYVKFYNEEKRFGFISEMGSETDYFVHEDNLIDKIKDKDKVLFEIGTGPKGLVAINVKLLKK